jgi:hypothetical protein
MYWFNRFQAQPKEYQFSSHGYFIQIKIRLL